MLLAPVFFCCMGVMEAEGEGGRCRAINRTGGDVHRTARLRILLFIEFQRSGRRCWRCGCRIAAKFMGTRPIPIIFGFHKIDVHVMGITPLSS